MKDKIVKNNLLAEIGQLTLSLLVTYSVQFWRIRTLTVTENKLVYGILSFQNFYQGYTD